jgi:hypothetical protein
MIPVRFRVRASTGERVRCAPLRCQTIPATVIRSNRRNRLVGRPIKRDRKSARRQSADTRRYFSSTHPAVHGPLYGVGFGPASLRPQSLRPSPVRFTTIPTQPLSPRWQTDTLCPRGKRARIACLVSGPERRLSVLPVRTETTAVPPQPSELSSPPISTGTVGRDCPPTGKPCRHNASVAAAARRMRNGRPLSNTLDDFTHCSAAPRKPCSLPSGTRQH